MCQLAVKILQAIVLTSIFCVTALSAKVLSPLPSEVTQQWQDLVIIGQTSLKRFGFHIYDASFWMTSRQNDESYLTNLSALSITYKKNIRAEKLLSSTKKEWRKLGIANDYPTDAWLYELQQIWPDVKKGDQLIFVFDPNGMSTFFNTHKKLGTIEDSRFGPAFLSIWLGKNASFKKSRNELLGKQK